MSVFSAFRAERNRLIAAMLIAIGLWGLNAMHLPGGRLGEWRHEFVRTASNRGLNKEAREALTAGYYEGLLNEGSRLSTMNRFVTDNTRPGWEDNSRPESRRTHDFLYYEHIPNKETPDYADQRFRHVLRTNSMGLGDKEYSLAKPPGVRRIALLGDSITRGLGAPPGGNFESMLEAKLNEHLAAGSGAGLEILNFAVSGYHITQQLEAARIKAAPFSPDVYVLALTDLSVYRRWHGHIATLLYSGIDLKYDYLKRIVAEARLSADDPIGIFDARLARYRLPTIRWVLSELKSFAVGQGAELMVLLVPSTEDPEQLAEAFLGVPEIVADLDVPMINLLDTFAESRNVADYRIAVGDRHPNAAGHKLLFQRLYERLQADPRARRTLLGGGVSDTSSRPETPR